MNSQEKPLFRFNGVQVQTPPMGVAARREAGFLLGLIQAGETLGMPHARPLFGIAPRLYELRIRETGRNWRIFYRADPDRVLLIHQINKTTPALTDADKNLIKERLSAYDAARQDQKEQR